MIAAVLAFHLIQEKYLNLHRTNEYEKQIIHEEQTQNVQCILSVI